MVVRGALAVSAVAGDLPVDLPDEQRPADRLAAAARRKLRNGTADDVQGKRFAEQVCVGAEVHRKMTFDMPELMVECEQQIKDPWRIGRPFRPRQRNAAPRATTATAGRVRACSSS